jgi:hypothetical protein
MNNQQYKNPKIIKIIKRSLDHLATTTDTSTNRTKLVVLNLVVVESIETKGWQVLPSSLKEEDDSTPSVHASVHSHR